MAHKRVWLITGAGRGMGVDIARAALGAEHLVVATGRNTDAVADAVGSPTTCSSSSSTSRAAGRQKPRCRPH